MHGDAGMLVPLCAAVIQQLRLFLREEAFRQGRPVVWKFPLFADEMNPCRQIERGEACAQLRTGVAATNHDDGKRLKRLVHRALSRLERAPRCHRGGASSRPGSSTGCWLGDSAAPLPEFPLQRTGWVRE